MSDAEQGRRGEILEAALAVFAEKGYAGGSMRDIAARVGVSEPALYRHFPGKEALFHALVRLAVSQLRDEAFALLDALTPEGLREQLTATLADRRRKIIALGPALRMLMPAAAHDPVVLREVRSTVAEPIRQHISAKIAELDAAYGVESDRGSRDGRTRVFMALFVGSLATSAVIGDEPDAVVAEAVVRLMGWEGRA